MEQWDIYTASGSRTGETVSRGFGVLKSGQYHLVVHIWVIDDRRRMLIQQRSANLDILPGKWAITGGSAVSGETPLSAACRELYEEVGIKAEENELRLIKTYRGRNDFVYVYALHKTVSMNQIIMQEAEVQAIKWVSTEDLREMVAEKKFHPYSYLPDLYAYLDTSCFNKKMK